MKMTRIQPSLAGQPTPEPIYDAEVVTYRLEDAGACLLALPARGCLPSGYRSFWPEVIVDAAEAYGYGECRIQPPVPSARRVTQMDEAFRWIGLLPKDRISHRRILLLRALTSPITGRHLHTWRSIGKMLGWDYRAVQRWHADGIGWIVMALYAQQCGGADWSRQWRDARRGTDGFARVGQGCPAFTPEPQLRTTRWS